MQILEEGPKGNACRVQPIFPRRTLLIGLRSAVSHFTRPRVLSEFHIEWLHEHDGGSSRLQHGLDRRDTPGGYPAVVSDQDHGALLAVSSAVSIRFSFPFSTSRAFLSRALQPRIGKRSREQRKRNPSWNMRHLIFRWSLIAAVTNYETRNLFLLTQTARGDLARLSLAIIA